jgi:hypothetical protein
MPPSWFWNILSLLSLVGGCGFALWRGAMSERLGGLIIFGGALLSYFAAVDFGHRWKSPEYALFAVDVLTLVLLVAVALLSDRYWPIWCSGFQLVAVVTHVAIIADRSVVPMAYSLAQPFWTYPMLISLVWGTVTVSKATRRSALRL